MSPHSGTHVGAASETVLKRGMQALPLNFKGRGPE